MFSLATKLLVALLPGTVAFSLAIPASPEPTNPTLTPVGLSIIPTDTSSEPQLFVDAAGQAFDREIQMGELALQRSSNVKVQAYARQTVDRNNRLLAQLNLIAQQVHAAPPRQRLILPEIAVRMGNLQGIDFDRAYLNASVSNHQAAIASFQNESLARNPRGINLQPLTQWAEQTVPILNEELTQAQSLSQSLGIAADAREP